MIDIWFLLLLILIVLTIIFHTAIAFLLGPYNQPFMKMDGGTGQVIILYNSDVISGLNSKTNRQWKK
jgi:hypothetical protein